LGFAVDTHMPEFVQLIPFGTNGDNDTFDMRMWGWSKVHLTELWIPQLLLQVNVVLGSASGAAIAADTFLADTLTLVEGSSEKTLADLISTADNTPASALVHTHGCQLIEFDFDLAGAQEGVSMNCYWRPVDEC
jgi:hypothetical protein